MRGRDRVRYRPLASRTDSDISTVARRSIRWIGNASPRIRRNNNYHASLAISRAGWRMTERRGEARSAQSGASNDNSEMRSG